MSPIETGLFSPRYAALPPIFYRVVAPQPLDAPHWAAISPDCAQLLGLNPATDFNDASLAVLAARCCWASARAAMASGMKCKSRVAG